MRLLRSLPSSFCCPHLLLVEHLLLHLLDLLLLLVLLLEVLLLLEGLRLAELAHTATLLRWTHHLLRTQNLRGDRRCLYHTHKTYMARRNGA